MASTFTPSIGLELQAPGENNNAWGARLNANGIALLDERIDGVASKTVTGDFTIIIQNMIASEGRKAVQLMTGTPVGDFTVTLPERMLNRWFHNKTGKAATITLGTGANCTVRDGQLSFVYSDPVLGCFVHDPTLDTVKAPAADVSLNNKKLTNLAAPSAGTDAASRAFVETAPAARSMGGNKITDLAAGVDATDAANVGQIAGIVDPIAQEAADSAQAAATSEANAKTSEDNAKSSEDNAAESEANAAASAAKLIGTSTTSNAIGTGSKTFATQAAKFFDPGMRVLITSDASPATRSMFGIVTAYAAGSLTVDVGAIVGLGTFTDWTIRICGERGAVGAPGTLNLYRSARTSNAQLVMLDIGKLIDITSGTFTQTFAAAATLGDGWWVYVRNSGTGDITLDPNASETIDGLATFVMYPGECRLVQCDGTALRSVVINAFVKSFIASATFVKPPGYRLFNGFIWGAGAGGRKDGGTLARGGGGGACSPFALLAADLGATESVTVGAGGLGATVDATNGGNGGDSIFAGITSKGAAADTGGTAFSAGSNPALVPGSGAGSFGLFGGGSGFNAAGLGGETIYGGAAGASIISSAAGQLRLTTFGGKGGAANTATSGANGAAPGGGGGATQTGPKAGDGARGEVRIWGDV